MRIIRPGTAQPNVYRAECKSCGLLVEYDESEARSGGPGTACLTPGCDGSLLVCHVPESKVILDRQWTK